MKIWAKLLIDGKIKKDSVYENSLKPTEKNFEETLREIAYNFDIATPLCLKSHYRHFKSFNIVRFAPADFVEDFPYDLLEVEAFKK